jgi:hypothetical protein
LFQASIVELSSMFATPTLLMQSCSLYQTSLASYSKQEYFHWWSCTYGLEDITTGSGTIIV